MHFKTQSLVVFVLLAAAGCHAPWPTRTAESSAVESPRGSNSKESLAATRSEDSEATNHEAALSEILDELTAIGAIDPDAKRLLMADLYKAKPDNWPVIVQQYRSALEYRQQLNTRDKQNAQAGTPASTQVVSANDAAPVEPAIELPPYPIVKVPLSPTPVAVPDVASPSATSISFASQPTSALFQATQAQAEPPKPPMMQVLAQPPAEVIEQVRYTTAVPSGIDWHEHLQTAITDLQVSVQPVPGSTDEVNDHMRLRLLQLLAGNEEAALMPIPGATAIKQDYWSKQLFAISTFLDSQELNDKRRAASSLIHLDQARAKLAELATLQVRKLAFVDMVDGYGAYQLRKTTEFSPGDRVTLYAEIENFTSESTKKGYRTRLGTSYEIVDENNKRIDSAEFPEVEDLCQNQRRDFHMQYTVTLPTRLPADSYELRLIITDQHSNKIGQASLPLVIAE